MGNVSEEETSTLEKHAIFFIINRLQVNIKPGDISVCHTMLASTRQPENVIVTFANRKKNNVPKNGRMLYLSHSKNTQTNRKNT